MIDGRKGSEKHTYTIQPVELLSMCLDREKDMTTILTSLRFHLAPHLQS